MSTPAWILEIFGAVMILVAEVGAGQLAAARAWTRHGGTGADVAVSLLLTGSPWRACWSPAWAACPRPAGRPSSPS